MPNGSSPQVPAGALSDLGLPARAVAALTRAGITTVADLAGLTRGDLAALDGVGPGTVAAIRRVVPEPGTPPAALSDDEESPAAPAIPSFESLRGPRRRSAVDLLTSESPPPADGPAPSPDPRPAEYADLVRLGLRVARATAGVPYRVVRWPVRRLRRLLGAVAGRG